MLAKDLEGHAWRLVCGILRAMFSNLAAFVENEALQRLALGGLASAKLQHHGRWHSIVAPSVCERKLAILVTQLFEASFQLLLHLGNRHDGHWLLDPLAPLCSRCTLSKGFVKHLDAAAMVELLEGIWVHVEGPPHAIRKRPTSERSP